MPCEKRTRTRPDGQPVADPICKKCGQRKTGTRNRCKPCRAESDRAKREANIERALVEEKARRDRYRAKPAYRGVQRAGHIQSRYGLSADEYQRMEQEQGGLCALCRERPSSHVDHDHNTGFVRGILCLTCNAGLGQFQENPDLLRRAAEYLEYCSELEYLVKRMVSA